MEDENRQVVGLEMKTKQKIDRGKEHYGHLIT